MSTTPTWESVEEMRRGMMLMLQGNHYFARQSIVTNSKGEQDQKYTPCYALKKLTRFEVNIFDGRETVGFYSIRPDNLTRWGGLDFDNHDGSKPREYWLPHAQSAFEALKKQFAEVWLVESSPGGFHVIAFANALMPAAEMRRILQSHAPAGVEVFPKQDELDASKSNAKGNLLRFPGHHQLKLTWAHFLDRSGQVQDVDGVAPAPKPSGWHEPTSDGRLRSLYVVATRGIQINEAAQMKRFKAMQKIAGRLKGRASEQEAIWVYTAWHNRNADKIGTPLQESRTAFLSWFNKAAPCNVTIPEYPLTEAENAMIAGLPKFPDVRAEHLASVVRLLLNAEHLAKDQGLATFWRSCRTISELLGIPERTANRIRSAAVKALDLDVIKKGHTGYATEYQIR